MDHVSEDGSLSSFLFYHETGQDGFSLKPCTYETFLFAFFFLAVMLKFLRLHVDCKSWRSVDSIAFKHAGDEGKPMSFPLAPCLGISKGHITVSLTFRPSLHRGPRSVPHTLQRFRQGLASLIGKSQQLFVNWLTFLLQSYPGPMVSPPLLQARVNAWEQS